MLNFNHYVFKDRNMLEFERNPCETLDFKHNLHNDSCKLGLSIVLKKYDTSTNTITL